MSHAIDIRFLLYFHSRWQSDHLRTRPIEEDTHVLPAADAIEHVDELIDHYLNLKNFDCCDVSIGLEVLVDGRSWTGYFCHDHLWHQMGWFYALSRVLKEGAVSEAQTFVWDESSLQFRRDHDRLTLQEERYYDFEWSPITVDLWDFAAKLLEAGQVYAALAERLTDEVLSRGFSEEELRTRLEGESNKPQPADDDLELKLAIILRELDYYIPEPIEESQWIVQRHAQLLSLEAALSRLVEILQLDPDFHWLDHFDSSLFTVRKLLESGFTKERLYYLSNWIRSAYGGMGSFNDYAPEVWDPETGRVTPIAGTEDFGEVASRVYNDAMVLRVIGLRDESWR